MAQVQRRPFERCDSVRREPWGPGEGRGDTKEEQGDGAQLDNEPEWDRVRG